MNKVLNFPKQTTTTNKPISKEEVDKNINTIHEYHVEETLQAILPSFFQNIGIAGFNSESDFDNRLCATIVESVRALLYNNYGMYHPIHDITKQLFLAVPEEEHCFILSDSVNVTFRKEDEV